MTSVTGGGHFTTKGRKRILENVRESMFENSWLVCEIFSDGVGGKEGYHQWMKDLTPFGFQKQQTIIPWWFNDKCDVSWQSRVYKCL